MRKFLHCTYREASIRAAGLSAKLMRPGDLAGVLDPWSFMGVIEIWLPKGGGGGTWAAGLAALLVEDLTRGLAALGAGLARGLAGSYSPCGKHNLGKHNTAPGTLGIENSTSWGGK